MSWRPVLWALALIGLTCATAQADDIPKDKSAFTDYMISRLQPYTLQRLSKHGDLGILIGDTRQYIPLDDIWIFCSVPQADCSKSADTFVQNAVYAYFNLPAVDPNVMRAGLYLDATKAFILDDGYADKGPPISRTLDGMLKERCFLDPERQGHELRAGMLDDLKLSENAALQICERNLRAGLGPLPDVYGQLGSDHIGMVKGSSSESARMILLDEWPALQAKLGGHLIAAAPTRDIIVYSGADDPASVEALKIRAKLIALSSPHPLEFDVYEFESGGWNQLTDDERGKVTLITHP